MQKYYKINCSILIFYPLIKESIKVHNVKNAIFRWGYKFATSDLQIFNFISYTEVYSIIKWANFSIFVQLNNCGHQVMAAN